MSKETGGPAFPVDVDGRNYYPGQTLRDHFAGMAMQSILCYPDAGLLDDDLTRYAGISYRAADAMLKARGE